MYYIAEKSPSTLSEHLAREITQNLSQETRDRFIAIANDLKINNSDFEKAAKMALQYEYIYAAIKKSTNPANAFNALNSEFKKEHQENWKTLFNTVPFNEFLNHLKQTTEANLNILENWSAGKDMLIGLDYEANLFNGAFDNNNDYLENFKIGKDKESNLVDDEITALIDFLEDTDSAKSFYINLFEKSDDENFRKELLKTITLEIAMSMVDLQTNENLLTIVNLLPEEYRAIPLHYLETNKDGAYSQIGLLITQLKFTLTEAPSSKKTVAVVEVKQPEVNEAEVTVLPKKTPPKSRFLEVVKKEYVDPDTLTTAEKRKQFMDMSLNNNSNHTYVKEDKQINTGLNSSTFAERQKALAANFTMFKPSNTNSANVLEVKPLNPQLKNTIAEKLNNNNNNNNNSAVVENVGTNNGLSFKERQNLLVQAMNKPNNTDNTNVMSVFPEAITTTSALNDLTLLNQTYLKRKKEINGDASIISTEWKIEGAKLRSEALPVFHNLFKPMVGTNDEKIAFCNDAAKLNVFCEHHENRSAFLPTGWKKTNAVLEIEKCRDEIQSSSQNQYKS